MESFIALFTGTAIANAPKNTGRVPDIRTVPTDERAYDAYRVGVSNRCADAPASQISELMNYRQGASPLNTRFFSVANTNLLQQQIQEQVYLKSGSKYKIDRQSDQDLYTIMRSYYLQYARNDPAAVDEELEALNHRVVAYCSDKIMVEIEAYKYYRADQENFPDPIQAPVNANVYGTRTGELKSFF